MKKIVVAFNDSMCSYTDIFYIWMLSFGDALLKGAFVEYKNEFGCVALNNI